MTKQELIELKNECLKKKEELKLELERNQNTSHNNEENNIKKNELVRSKYYRKSLGKHIGEEIALESNNFRISQSNENGEMFMILEQPQVIKISGRKIKKEWIVHHLWVKVPLNKVQYHDRYLSLFRKILVTGIIQEYNYTGNNMLQVGVQANSIKVLKYRKDIAKKYSLKPGQKLSKNLMDTIITSEELSKASEENVRTRVRKK